MRVTWCRDMQRHKHKLDMIKQRSEVKLQTKKLDQRLDYKKALQVQTKNFLQHGMTAAFKLILTACVENTERVNRDNQMLLNKLVDISQGKGLSVASHEVIRHKVSGSALNQY